MVFFNDPVPIPDPAKRAVNIDQPGKAEVNAELLRSSLFVCDDRDLAVTMGAAGGAGVGAEVIDAELGEVIAGVHPGRTEPDQITIFGSVGLAFQDLVRRLARLSESFERRYRAPGRFSAAGVVEIHVSKRRPSNRLHIETLLDHFWVLPL